jgi:hypothetical protein
VHKVITVSEVNSIIKKLWSPLADGSKPNVFMVLDGARDKRIEPLINNSNIEQSCLYAGKLSYALKRAAPHIVKLIEDSSFTEEILTLCWGNSWGIFLLANQETSIKTVRANCRRLAKVKGINGENLVFRYYDPRVTRLMLPVCNQYEVDCILGDSISLLMEQEHELGFTLFERGDEKTPVRSKNFKLNAENQSLITGSTKNAAHTWKENFQLRQSHMDAIQSKLYDEEFSAIKEDYIDCYLKDITDELSFNVASKEVNLDSYLRLCFNKAKEFKLDSRDSVLTFISMNHQYGWLFWTKEEYQWVEDILLSGRPCEAKIETISKKFSRILMERMWS